MRSNFRFSMGSVSLLALLFADACSDQTIGPNWSPVARVQVAKAVALGYSVELDGSQSYDPEGDALTEFLWEIGSLDLPVTLVEDLGSERMEFTPPNVGAFKVQLVVSDGEDLSAPDLQLFRAVPAACTSDLSCDDGDPCTEDVCQDGLRCLNIDHSVPCDDGDPCTTHDVMCAGRCIPSAVDRDVDGDGALDKTCQGGTDCDDLDAGIHPGAREICDGLDTDCDGVVPPVERDSDGDGFVACDPFFVAESVPTAGGLVGGGDCDENDRQESPAAAEGPFGDPSCADGRDNNCNELKDADDPSCQPAEALFACRRRIIVDHRKVSGSTPLAHFALLVRIDSDPRLSRAGGCVQSEDARDLVFVGEDRKQLAHQVESYDGASGSLLAWVAVPSLSPQVDTVIHLWSGRAILQGPSAQPAAVWDEHYRAVWHLDEQVADEASDGLHRDATANQIAVRQGGNNPVEGRLGLAQNLDGNDFLDSGLPSNGVGSLTFSLWFNSADAGGIGDSSVAQRFITQKRDAGASRLAFGINNNHLAAGWYKNGLFTTIEGTTALAKNTWYRADLSYDGSTFRLFLDGVEEKSYADSGIAAPSPDPLQIGRQSPNLAQERYFRGLLDEVAISATARSPDWIRTSFANQAAPGQFYQLAEE